MKTEKYVERSLAIYEEMKSLKKYSPEWMDLENKRMKAWSKVPWSERPAIIARMKADGTFPVF